MQVTSAPDGRLKMQELAHSVLLSKSGVTRLVDRMVEAGLMERQACDTDRRAIYAAATPAGRAALRDALPVHGDSLRRNFSEVLTPDEISKLRSTLTKILTSGGFVPTPCPTGLEDTSTRVRGRSAAKRS
jgi:DNA-binding MarR family transcriptional regulator